MARLLDASEIEAELKVWVVPTVRDEEVIAAADEHAL